MSQFTLGRAKAQMVKTLEEYYNAIQVNIQFSGSDIKVITVTSVQPSEGKSTTSTDLMEFLARMAAGPPMEPR